MISGRLRDCWTTGRFATNQLRRKLHAYALSDKDTSAVLKLRSPKFNNLPTRFRNTRATCFPR